MQPQAIFPLVLTAIAPIALQVIACNILASPASPPIPTGTHELVVAPPPTRPPLPTPTAVPGDLVWLAPNMGSLDYPELFSRPDNWSLARSRINVFKFYTQNALEDPCDICGANHLRTFVDVRAFEQLADWGIAIAAEVGAIKEWGCTGDDEFRAAQLVVENIQANQGRVTFLAMDEPMIGGDACLLERDVQAFITTQFITRVRSSYPHILVGDIEPYPHYSVTDLEGWILALQELGAGLAFFHLDVDLERVRVEQQDITADLQTLSKFCQEHNIPFGVIFTANWTAAGTNRTYYQSTMAWVQTVKEAIGKPPHVVFQSWLGPAPSGDHEVPINLPQNDPENYSHIRLLNQGLAVLDE